MSKDYKRIELDRRAVPGDESSEPFMSSAAAEVRRALISYPHFCVIVLPENIDDKSTFIALAAAIAGEERLYDADGGWTKRVSFSNVRIDGGKASAPRKTGTRYSRTNLPMAPHTDSSFRGQPHELVAFHCVTHDDAGGESVLATVEDVLRPLDAETIARLREPVYPFGKSLRAVLRGEPGREEIRYYRTQLDRPLEDGTAQLSPEHRAAIDALDAVLEQSERFHELLLRSGEILFLHNRKVMHGRAGFSGESNRHFRRIRLRARVLREARVR